MKNRAETHTKSLPLRFAKLAVAAVAIAAHLNTLPNDYCYDDVPIVRDSALINEPGKTLTIWTTDYWGESVTAWKHRDLLYRPATVASFRIVRTIFGSSPFPQHAVNILLHALVTVLIVRVGLMLKLSVSTAAAAALLFAVLPIHVEAVAPIVGRADLLAAAATLFALLAHAKSIAHPGNRRLFFQSVSAVAAFTAMTAKETGAAVIPILTLYIPLNPLTLELLNPSPFEPLNSSSLKPFKPTDPPNQPHHSNLRHWFPSTIYLLLPLIAYLTLRYIALDGVLFQQPAPTKTVNALIDSPPWQRFLGVFQLFGMYWLKTLWPQTLCISYAINAVTPATSLLDSTVLVGLGVFVALLAWSAIAWHRGNRTVALLTLFLLLAYLPTANAFVLIQVFFAERIWYLPSIAACLLIALAVQSRLPNAASFVSTATRHEPSPVNTATARERAWRLIGFVVVAAMLTRGWIRNAEWRDNGRLYSSCYRDHPESIACLNLYGTWLIENNRIEEGIPLLNRALEMDLGFTDAQRAIGHAYLILGDLDRAVRHLQAADMQVPHHAPTVASLADAVGKLRLRHADRLAELERAAAADPPNLDAELNYIRALRDLGLVADALQRLKSREPTFDSAAQWHYEYAVTLVLLDQPDAAIDQYRKTLALFNPSTLEPLNSSTLEPLNSSTLEPLNSSNPSTLPPSPSGRENSSGFRSSATVELAMLLLERRGPGDIDEAGRLCQTAQPLDPNNPAILICRAEHAAVTGNLAAAKAAYNRVVAQLPPDHPQRRILEQRVKTLGR